MVSYDFKSQITTELSTDIVESSYGYNDYYKTQFLIIGFCKLLLAKFLLITYPISDFTAPINSFKKVETEFTSELSVLGITLSFKVERGFSNAVGFIIIMPLKN